MSEGNGVFIIESLNFEDEERGFYEGKIITEILRMLDVPVKYTYIRTKKELKHLIRKFDDSNFKYLHLSCHGNNEGIGMTLDKKLISFQELSNMFYYIQHNQRLFLSSCSAMQGSDVLNGLSDTKFLSIAGPVNDIEFSDATIFWSSFYHLMFRKKPKGMKNSDFKDNVDKLSETFDIPMKILIRKKSSDEYKEHINELSI